MNLLKSSVLAVACLLPSVGLASTWEADAAHAGAYFTVRHMMISDVRGQLGPVTSTLEFDDKDVTKSKVEATIDLTKINTQNEKRDAHLKKPDFFDTEKFPTLSFKSTKVEKGASADKLKVHGELTIKNVTKPVTLDVTLSAETANPWTKAPTRAAVATGTIDRREWNLVWQQPMANNGIVADWNVKLELQVEYVKKDTKKVDAAQPAPAKQTAAK